MLKFDKNANPNTELITCESFADKFVKMRSKYNRAIVAKYVQYWKNYTFDYNKLAMSECRVTHSHTSSTTGGWIWHNLHKKLVNLSYYTVKICKSVCVHYFRELVALYFNEILALTSKSLSHPITILITMPQQHFSIAWDA